jgi:primosomal protein N' (replication factor Y)
MRPILRVAVDTPLRRLFDYRLPPDYAGPAPAPGVRVRVPFGKQRLIGVLIEVADFSAVPAAKLRPALEILDSEPAIDGAILDLASWAADYYHHPTGEVLAAALPLHLREGAPLRAASEHWQLTELGRANALATLGKRGPKQRALIELLHERGPASAATLAGFDTKWRDPLRALIAKGWVERVDVAPPTAALSSVTRALGPELTPAQSAALAALVENLDRFAVWLLHGVTGSGKTEVYLRCVEHALARDRQALVLVPEITLTPQLVSRFEQRFAAPIAVLHSGLGDSERLAAWRHARAGEVGIVIGTRSAVFTPLRRPGLIVVDEEHDASYKQQDGFRYSARDLAIVRAQRERVPVILGSATPSLESLENATQQRYQRLSLPERPGAARHPRVTLIDLRREAVESGLAFTTLSSIERHLGRGGQVLLYLNRRGYAPTLFCPGCGWMAPCHNCDARMTVHLRRQRLRCHHCGADERLPLGCPTCGHEVKPVGQGTERVEDALRDRFRNVELVRFDRDNVRRRGDLQELLDRVNTGEARILVGTQMLSKGHDFPDVTLVVIVHADQGLFSADFRASERLAQTIVQVSGRAGRASRPGEVLIQTEFPEHPLLKSLIESGYDGFARAALEERNEAQWPPYARLALMRADAPELASVMRFLELARDRATPPPANVQVLGPVPASMARRADRHHAQLLVQSPSRGALQKFLGEWLRGVEQIPLTQRVHWSLDVDPIDLH